ncbi:MAG: hypothetical protein JO154_15320 [Chitinophaga sp.]|uniref:hypothetical protein n=1 Tax=Chitinophaga sp. TaxID=1869181 RepID=UPI0025BF5122|nr:hypothetical protein [Chitinophaga sp.]MBV8253972.1 hypothetical protein [Chitinophaga sp.]
MKQQTNATGAQPVLELRKEIIAKADFHAVSNLSAQRINAKGKSGTLTNETTGGTGATMTSSIIRTVL